MSKLNTNAKRKRQKPQEAATKAERCKWDQSYCAKHREARRRRKERTRDSP